MEHADVITQQWGAFGAVFLLVLGPLAAFAIHQTRELAKARKEQVDDAKQVQSTVIAVIKDFSESAREQVRAQAEQRAVSESVADAIGRMEQRIGTLEESVGRLVVEGNYPRRPR